MICRFCGNENNDSSTNCYICGKSLASNIATSLVDIGSNESNQSYAINTQNDQYANRFASDTGGGPSIGPQSFSSRIMAGETTKKSGGAGSVVIVILLLLALAAGGWYLFLSDNAPLGYLLNKASVSESDVGSMNSTAAIIMDIAE